jgi:copper resistance protein B
MRRLWLIPAAIATIAAALSGKASADQFHAAHGPSIFWAAGGKIDATSLDWLPDPDTGTVVHWDTFAWIGTDNVKLRLEAEGEAHDGDIEESTLKSVLSFPLDEFWDIQAGMRFDTHEGGRTWAAFGLHGLAPWFIETDAFVFIDGDGNIALEFAYEMDFALTQDLFLQPHIKLEAFAQEIPQLEVAEGLAEVELALQLRYEITRKFAPYVELVWERDLGETSSLRQALGEDVENTTLRAGIRFRL